MAVTAKFRGRHGHPPSEVEHHQTMHQRTRLEDDFPYIVFLEVTRLHGACDYIGGHIRCGRLPGPEILRVLACTFALSEKHQLEQARMIEGVVEEHIQDLQ